jgi:hypothetical protein
MSGTPLVEVARKMLPVYVCTAASRQLYTGRVTAKDLRFALSKIGSHAWAEAHYGTAAGGVPLYARINIGE